MTVNLFLETLLNLKIMKWKYDTFEHDKINLIVSSMKNYIMFSLRDPGDP